MAGEAGKRGEGNGMTSAARKQGLAVVAKRAHVHESPDPNTNHGSLLVKAANLQVSPDEEFPPPIRDPGEPPVLDWIDKTLIDVDPAYQRPLDEARVQRILDWFSWRDFGAIVVARKDDGFNVTDGQHRLEAAKRHPKIQNVPAVIIDANGVAGEAANFVAINVDRKNISALDRHWAQVAAEDPEAVTVNQVCERAGLALLRHPAGNAAYKLRETIAVSALRALIDGRGAMRAREVLDVLANAELAPITGAHIRAAELLMVDPEFCNEVDAAGITDSFLLHGDEIEVEAKSFGKTHRLSAARALASVWFRRTRKKRRAAA